MRRFAKQVENLINEELELVKEDLQEKYLVHFASRLKPKILAAAAKTSKVVLLHRRSLRMS